MGGGRITNVVLQAFIMPWSTAENRIRDEIACHINNFPSTVSNQNNPVFLLSMSKIMLVVCILCTLSACQDDGKAGSKKAKAGHLVETILVKKEPLRTRRIALGSLEAKSTVQIFNEESGRIIKLPYYPGDEVKAGDELVVLDGTLIQAEADKATAAYKQAQLDYKRVVKLMPRNLASEDELARAKTAVDEAKAELDLQDARLNHTQIRAPFDGVISQRLKETGDVVPLHSHILSVFDPHTLIIKLDISEILLANIDKGYQVKIRIDALGDIDFNGTVTRKYPTIDPVTRQGVIEVTLDPVPPGAQPGQLCRVTIEGTTQPLRSVPLSVVRHDTRGEFVYKINQDKAEYTAVRTGVQMGASIEIIEGLNDGDQIISKGFLGLRNGKTVKITGTINQADNPPDIKQQTAQ